MEGNREEGEQGTQEMRAIEDGEEEEQRALIGQELVPVQGTREVARLERRPEDIPVPASPYPVRGEASSPGRQEMTMALSMLQTPPRGQPRALGPPLFTEQQLKVLEQGYKEAPLVFGGQSVRSKAEQRAMFLADEEKEAERMELERRRQEDQELMWRMVQDARAETEVWRSRNAQLAEDLKACEKALADLQFRTPDSRRDKDEKAAEELPNAAGATGSEKRSDDPPRAQAHIPAESMEQQMTLKVMLAMMQNMQEMQRQLATSRDAGKEEDRGDVECVRSGTQELPKLPEWSATTGPIDFTDWINLRSTQVALALGPKPKVESARQMAFSAIRSGPSCEAQV